MITGGVWNFICGSCDKQYPNRYWSADNPATRKCDSCGGDLVHEKRRKNPTFGQMSHDINSDLFYKTASVRGRQKVSEAKRLLWSMNKVERMETDGRTARVDDYAEMREAIDYYAECEAKGISLGEPEPSSRPVTIDWRKKAKESGIKIVEEMKPA